MAIALASRVYSLIAMAVIASMPGMRGVGRLFSVWDANWYFGIASSGYHGGLVHARHDFAFFPAWPLLIKIGSLNGLLPSAAVGAVLANALFVLAAVLIWRVIDARVGRSAATGGVLLLAFAPSAYIFSLPYSEPLFLVSVGLYFVLGPSSRWRLPLSALSMFMRIAGAALVVSALVRAARTHGRERLAALAAAAAGCLAFAIWWLFIAYLTQRLTGFLTGSPSWDQGAGGLYRILWSFRHPSVQRALWLGFMALVTVGAVRLLRVDVELAAFALAALAFALLPGGTLNSMPRYALSAFPAFAGIAYRLDRRAVAGLAVLFAAAQLALIRWVLATHGVAP